MQGGSARRAPWRRRAGALVATAAAAASLSAVLAASAANAATTASRGPAGSPAKDPEPAGVIGHTGRWLTDQAGRVVLLHGVNMVEKQAPYYPAAFGFGRQDAKFLAHNGLDVVRLGVLGTGLMPTPGHVDHRYLNHLATTVRQLAARHVYVLLDLHQDGFSPTVGSDGFPAWMTLTHGAVNNHAGFPNYYFSDPATQAAFQSLWDNERGPNGTRLQSDVATMVQALGRRFAGTRDVLGYDVFNEPWPGVDWTPCLSKSGCPAITRRELDPLYARVDSALRSVDHRHLLFIEPFVLFNFGTAAATVALPPGDQRSGLSFHQYATSPTAAAGVLRHALAWSRRTGGTLLDTEWGATTSSSAITSQAGQFDHDLVPWIFWSFDVSLVHDIGQPPRGSNLVQSTADALVRPYPSVVAGTPEALHFDPATRHLHVRWSVTEPDGARARAGAVSTIEAPQRVYPTGYSVSVRGARVTSRPCATRLTLATEAGARSVEVAVSPGGSCAA